MLKFLVKFTKVQKSTLGELCDDCYRGKLKALLYLFKHGRISSQYFNKNAKETLSKWNTALDKINTLYEN
jgi:hypothetical protein